MVGGLKNVIRLVVSEALVTVTPELVSDRPGAPKGPRPVTGSGPAVFVKQMSLVHAAPVNEKTFWVVSHVQAAPTPVDVPAGREDAKPPGPAENQLKVNESPIALFVTLFLILTGNVVTTVRLAVLSLPLVVRPSRSMVLSAPQASGIQAPTTKSRQ